MIEFLIRNIHIEKRSELENIYKVNIYKLNNLGLISDIIPIINDGSIIGYRLLSKNFSSESNNWINAWHGTKFENLESIIKYGLQLPGQKLPDGTFVSQSSSYPMQEYILGIKNWEKSIFASSCINCASMYSFDALIECGCFGFEYPYSPTLVEIKIKTNTFTRHYCRELVGINGHVYCGIYHNDLIYRIPSQNYVIIKSNIFIDTKFLSNNNWNDKSGVGPLPSIFY